MLPDLRLHFRKYEVAESYAQFYRDMYGQQYKFRVIGLRNKIGVWCIYTIIVSLNLINFALPIVVELFLAGLAYMEY